MKYALGLIILAVSAAPAFASLMSVSVPGPELAAGLPSVIAVAGAYAVTRFIGKR